MMISCSSQTSGELRVQLSVRAVEAKGWAGVWILACLNRRAVPGCFAGMAGGSCKTSLQVRSGFVPTALFLAGALCETPGPLPRADNGRQVEDTLAKRMSCDGARVTGDSLGC
jgi:hypothetical protein